MKIENRYIRDGSGGIDLIYLDAPADTTYCFRFLGITYPGDAGNDNQTTIHTRITSGTVIPAESKIE